MAFSRTDYVGLHCLSLILPRSIIDPGSDWIEGQMVDESLPITVTHHLWCDLA